VITRAVTDAERAEVQDLFEATFDIDAHAVPMTSEDDLYAPLIVRYTDQASGRLVAAALTCRSGMGAASATARRHNLPDPGYASVMDKHSELDLMCVLPEWRGRGIGGQLIGYLEAELRERGVRAWFGNATKDLDLAALRAFYTRHGFTVLEDGQPLPPLLGKNWTSASTEPTGFYFYKVIANLAGKTP